MLEVSDLRVHYGDFRALFGVSLSVGTGDAVAVIGANGAGKSTLLKAIAGTLVPSGGDIRFDGRSIVGISAPQRVAMGISMVPEGRRIFRSLTVRENLMIGNYRRRSGPWDLGKVLGAFPLLQRLIDRPATRLSGGEQQALAIGRALMNNPTLLLLDEVSLGLAPVVVKQVYAALPAIRAEGTTMLLVEQDVNQALAAAELAYCLLEGRVSLLGRSDSLSREAITSAYFGTSRSVTA
jgi:branched-chain amino acid transport system ATP-binding protein